MVYSPFYMALCVAEDPNSSEKDIHTSLKQGNDPIGEWVRGMPSHPDAPGSECDSSMRGLISNRVIGWQRHLFPNFHYLMVRLFRYFQTRNVMDRLHLPVRLPAALHVFFLALFVTFSTLEAQVVNNGSVTGSPAANSGIQAGNAPPWDRCSFSPDLCSVTFASYTGNSQVPRVASPDGGTWLGVAALGECAETTISGLSVGSSYTLYFCGANFGTGSLYNGPNVNILVQVGTASQNYNIPMVANIWNPYTLNFTASATTMNLLVTAVSGSGGYGSLDGFNLVGNICNPVILPEALEGFAGELKDCQAHLQWEMPLDYEVETFEIQRGNSGGEFQTVDKIAYTSSGTYTYVDPFPITEGRYRLRLVHADGHIAESSVIHVSGNCHGQGLEVLPNPVEAGQLASLRFFSREGSTTLVISNMKGQVVRRLQPQGIAGEWNDAQLNTLDLEAGVYIVKSSDGGIAKMVIQ